MNADSTSTSYRAPKELDWTGGDPCAVVLRLDTQAAFAVACGMQKFWGDKDTAPKQLFRAVCDFEGVDAEGNDDREATENDSNLGCHL